MSTFYTTVNLPIQPEMPGWMREERYMFCEQSTSSHTTLKNAKFWATLKKVFS